MMIIFAILVFLVLLTVLALCKAAARGDGRE